MIQLTNVQSQVLIEVFEQLHLGEDLVGELEEYMDGKRGEEVLSKLSFQDLKNRSSRVSSDLFLTFAKKGMAAEARRFFNILFAVGGPSCGVMLPDVMTVNRDKKIGIEPEKVIAVYAYECGERDVSEPNRKRFEMVTQGNTEWIRKALCYKKGQKESGKLVLYALYFLFKYPDGKPAVQGDFEEGVLGGIHRFFEKGKNVAEDLLEEEDRELMREYEDCVCGQVNMMLNQGLLSEERKQITEGLHQEELSEEIKKLVKRHTVIFDVVKRTAGLAFINFAFSNCLRNFLVLSFSINRMATLEGMSHADFRQDLRIRGGNFDQIFGIDTEKYILWAAEKSHKNILRVQFEQNRESYIHCCDTAPVPIASRMIDVVREQDPSFYQQRKDVMQEREQEKVVKEAVKCYFCDSNAGCFTNNKNLKQVGNTIQDYLEGRAKIEQLYLYEDQIEHQENSYSLVDQYYRDYGGDAFYRRCMVYIAMEKYGYYFRKNIRNSNVEEETKRIFTVLKQENMDFVHQIKLLINIADDMRYQDNLKKKFVEAAKSIFMEYLLKQREEVLAVFQGLGIFGRQFVLRLLDECALENKQEILAVSKDSSKIVRETLIEILYQHMDWEEEVKEFLSAKRAAEREIGIRVLAHWGAEKYRKELEQALEKEKNGKVQMLLKEVLQMETEEETEEQGATKEGLVKSIHIGGRSRSLAWAYQKPFSVVHKKNGEEASKEYLQAILLYYSTMQPCGVSKDAVLLAEELQPAELAVYVNELFDRWMEAGAEAKKRWVLFAASIHGGMEIVKKLQHQIQEWPKYARGAIASDAVQALALNPDPQALLIVDGITRKFKFKQVRTAAGKALDFAAAQLGLEREELEDRIVPDLGFNEQMERVFDYGERRFTVTITTALEIEVFDEKKKKLKSLPAPGKKDDPEKAALAYETFKQMKKQMKTTISSQKARLDWALSSERIWSAEAWEALFVKNPLMHQFAIGLIWGIYQDGNLVQSFRYMEDGTFNTEEEEEFVLPKEGKIGLVHPIELSEESREAWKEQLEDYEIVQPIVQLEREIFYLTEEEKNARNLERFGGCVVNDLSLGGKLQTFGWYRGSILDGGGFYTYYREDTKIGYGVELHFSGSFVGGGEGDVTLYDARFYKVGRVNRSNYSLDEVKIEDGIVLSELPKRYFSEIVRQLSAVTAFCKEREKEEEWKKERGTLYII